MEVKECAGSLSVAWSCFKAPVVDRNQCLHSIRVVVSKLLFEPSNRQTIDGPVDSSNPITLLTVAQSQGALQLTAAGDWTAIHAGSLDEVTGSVLVESSSSGSMSIDMQSVRSFDTFGAWHLARLVRELGADGRELKVVGLPERFAGIFEAVREASAPSDNAGQKVKRGLSVFASIGKATIGAWQSFTLLLNMLGAVCDAIWRVIRRPSAFRLTSTVHQLDRVAWQAVPIILLITFLIGAIIAQQGFFHFRKFGADDYVVDMVGILVLRELGVLIVAIMVAGRSGSSYTAELGSMKMREEIDALRTMGFDPIEVLVLPRIIALVIALPILTFLGSMSALYGGELVAWLYGGMSPDIFVARLKDAISITHFKVGMIKAPFMAIVIGIVACTEGFKVAGSAESLGLHTTASVVMSIFLVIVLDGLFAIFFASIGM
jgi:phospholipid/cholesterol/gamma-HCH transport system permease protein